MAEQRREKPESPAQRPTGPVSKFLSFFLNLIGMLILSLFFSILVEWVMLAFVWSDEGHHHAKQAYHTELGYLNDDLGDSLFNQFTHDTPRQMAEQFSRWIYDGYKALRLDKLHDHLAAQYQQAQQEPITHWAIRLSDGAAEALLATLYVSLLFVTRIIVLLHSLPTFFLFGMMGMVDGLVMRDVRRWSAGRESSWLYHHAKRYLLLILATPFVIYLSLPWSVSPTWIVIPFAALEGIVLQVTLKMFKKHI